MLFLQRSIAAVRKLLEGETGGGGGHDEEVDDQKPGY